MPVNSSHVKSGQVLGAAGSSQILGFRQELQHTAEQDKNFPSVTEASRPAQAEPSAQESAALKDKASVGATNHGPEYVDGDQMLQEIEEITEMNNRLG